MTERNRTDRTDGTDSPGIIPAHGGYRDLKSYQTAEIIHDATVAFCDRLIPRTSRTHDQMVQAARSGKQNIAEGSRASGTSKKSELKLVGVARASLEELLLDFQDFLRQRGLPLYTKEHHHAQAIRKLASVLSVPSVPSVLFPRRLTSTYGKQSLTNQPT